MAQQLSIANLKISSSAFENHGPIPPRHTGDDEDISPPLRWAGVPEGTEALGSPPRRSSSQREH